MRRRSPRFAILGSAPKVLQVATRAEMNTALSGSLTDANRKGGGRCRGYFSVDCDNIQIGVTNYYVADVSSNVCLETDNANAVTWRIALEYNNTAIAFTWDGGASSKAVAAGEALALTDKLPASDFGLTKFTAGDQFWLRMERVVANGGHWLYKYAAVNSPSISGERFFTAATTATDVLTDTGDWPTTGGWSASSVVWLPACIIGEVRTPHMASAVIGASIEDGSGDTGRGDGFNGSGGYMRRGYVDQKGAKIMLCKAGESAASFVANSVKRRALLPYVNHAWTAHGGNDYTYGASVGTTEGHFDTIWGWLKDEGIYVHHVALSVKTDSTDSWATTANQTPRSGFETGGNWRDVVNAYAAGKVGTAIDAYSDFDASQADATDIDVWRVDLGTPTTDGTHPTAVIHAAMGSAFEALIAADKLVIEV